MSTPTTEDLFASQGGVTSENRAEVARLAVRNFQKMLPSLNAYVRALTGSKATRIEMSKTSNGATDGKRIFYRPPIALGDPRPHDRALCDVRDSTGLQSCEACRTREAVLVTIYHEVAHIVFKSFDALSRNDRKAIFEQVAANRGDEVAERAQKALDSWPSTTQDSYMAVTKLINPFFPFLLNAIEDARVNRELFQARRGTKKMFEASVNQVFEKGVEQFDSAKGATVVVKWCDYPLNLQASIGMFCLVSGYDPVNWLTEKVVTDLADPALQSMLRDFETVKTVSGSFTFALRAFIRLRELGYYLTEEERASQNQQEDNSEESESKPGEDASPSDAGEGESSDESDDSDASSSDEGVADDDDESEPADDGQAGDLSDDSTDSTEPAEDDTDGGEADPEQGDEGSGEPAGTSDGSGDPKESDDEAATDSAGGSSLHESNEDPLADGEVRPEPGEATDDSDSVEESSTDPEGMGTESGAATGPAPATEDGPESATQDAQDAPADDGGTPISPDDDEPAESNSSESDPSAESGEDLVDSGEDHGYGDGIDLTELEWGTPEECEKGAEEAGFHRHEHDDEDEGDKGVGEILDKEALDVAIVQAGYFETPSANVSDIDVRRYSETDKWGRLYSTNNGLAPRRGGFGEWLREETAAPQAVLNSSLMRLRAIFTDNARGATSANLKSGKINARVLGKRAPLRDPRLFRKNTQPGKKDYAVMLMMDNSYSTAGVNAVLIKKSVRAQAEMLARIGVKFSIVAHSHTGNGWATTGLIFQLFEIKNFDEPWTNDVLTRLINLPPSEGNLDGHALEYARKQVMSQSATDRIIMYYSDGAMPASNHDEELEILQREIAYCRRDQVTLLGVGVQTDSPTRHGLETVRFDDIENLPEVVRHLERKIK